MRVCWPRFPKMEFNFIKGRDLSFGPIPICLALRKVVRTQPENPEI